MEKRGRKAKAVLKEDKEKENLPPKRSARTRRKVNYQDVEVPNNVENNDDGSANTRRPRNKQKAPEEIANDTKTQETEKKKKSTRKRGKTKKIQEETHDVAETLDSTYVLDGSVNKGNEAADNDTRRSNEQASDNITQLANDATSEHGKDETDCPNITDNATDQIKTNALANIAHQVTGSLNTMVETSDITKLQLDMILQTTVSMQNHLTRLTTEMGRISLNNNSATEIANTHDENTQTDDKATESPITKTHNETTQTEDTGVKTGVLSCPEETDTTTKQSEVDILWTQCSNQKRIIRTLHSELDHVKQDFAEKADKYKEAFLVLMETSTGYSKQQRNKLRLMSVDDICTSVTERHQEPILLSPSPKPGDDVTVCSTFPSSANSHIDSDFKIKTEPEF